MNGPLRSLVCLLSGLIVSWTLLTAAESREPRYLTFTARDSNGIYLRNLKLEEVSLWIDEQPCKVSYLGYQNVDSAIVFMFENSPRTAPHPVSMPQWGRINPIDQIRYQMMTGYFPLLVKNGVVLLGEFFHEVKVVQDFTSEDYLLEDAIARMQPNSVGMRLEDIAVARALGRGIDLLRKRPEKRKILVLFTTTVDRESYRNMEEYRELLRRDQSELYVMSHAPRFPSAAGTTFEERMNRYYFLRLVEETAGKLYLSGEYAFVSEFTDDLKTRLSNSYTLGFYVQPSAEPQEHKVRLRVRHDKIEVSHRKKLVY